MKTKKKMARFLLEKVPVYFHGNLIPFKRLLTHIMNGGKATIAKKKKHNLKCNEKKPLQ